MTQALPCSGLLAPRHCWIDRFDRRRGSEGDPAAEDVVDGFGEIVARRQASTLLAHPDFEIVDERLCSLLTDSNTFSGCPAVDGPLDFEQFVDPATASAAIGDFDKVARSKNFLRPWLQHALR
jgi:hypothetical protein